MDNLLYNNKKQKQYNSNSYTKIELKNFIESKCAQLMGIKVLTSNYYINKQNNDYIETLGIDENLKMVIIEYRIGKFSRVIQNGLIHIDYIKAHQSEFKMLVNDNLTKLNISLDESKNIDYNARLVVIGESFHKYDGDSIAKMPYNIELITFKNFNKEFILLNKTYISKNIDLSNVKYNFNEEEKQLLFSLNDFILSLGEEINITGNKNIIFYRKIKTFMYVVLDNGINIIINGKMKSIKKENDIVKLEKDIESIYDKE